MRKTIKAADFAQDFRLGMGDQAMMGKYHLTEEQLERVFGELWRRGLISDDEIEDRLDVTDSQVTLVFSSAKEDTKELD
ncbi:MAG: hypothetical protein FJ118_05990 [Deltaproteobacteria bacterium]|nr:hypothetical protein [Deltaproteobacteria bacterium]MBM4326700.1 hypothetical protein [Deltaproteobacteria bacterium]